MPDRYDPKLTVRPPGDRKAAELPADGDPLAELARIVSGRPPADASAPRAKAGVPAAEPDVERDLEAELLNDLQASFAALGDPLDAVAADEPDPEVEPDPEPLPPPLPAAPIRVAAERPPEPKPEPPARKQPEPFSFDISQAFDEAEAAAARVVRAEQAKRAEPPREPRPYAPPLRGPAAVPRTDEPRNETPPRPEPAPRAAPPAPRPPAPPAMRGDPASAPPRRAPPPRAERTAIPVRPLPMDDELHAAAPPPRQVTPRPPRAEPPPPPSSRFAPHREPVAAIPPPAPPRRAVAAAPPPPEPYHDDADLDLIDLPDDLDGPYEDDFSLDDLDTAAYADDEFPPFPEEQAGRGRRRSGRVFAVIAGMLAIVAVGGAAVFLYRGDESGSGGPPPIIAAEQGPTKVPPEATGDTSTESDSQSKLIYDRVADASDEQDTRLVTGQPEIGSIPADDGVDDSNPISRVIIPGGPADDSSTFPDSGPDSGNAAPATDENGIPRPPVAEEGADSIGPRMVRTVVVKPDGTIVSSEATGVDENGNALPGQEPTEMALAEPEIPPPPRSEMDAVLEGGNLSVNTDPLSAPGSREEPVMAAPAPEPEAPDPAPPAPAPVAAAPAPEPAPLPAPTPRNTQAAPSNGNGPIDLVAGTAPAGEAQAGGGGSALVQVTAQRSEEAASTAYRSLQRKFPSILGSFQPKIVRADLGDKGVFYRVRVGPFTNGDAARLCADLKAAGGDCMTVR